MLEAKTTEYYEWPDIREFLCEQLGITERQFRDYGSKFIEGGNIENEYMDFWHVWLWMIDDRIMNDSYMPYFAWEFVWQEDDNENEELEYFKEQLVERFDKWALDIIPPLFALHKEITKDTEYGEKEILIHYSW